MKPSALIVAHGQPSDPKPAEKTIAALAAKVAEILPDWHIGSATLAAPESLKYAVHDIESAIIFPLFMSDGWFVRDLLPKRLEAAGACSYRILPPFGTLPDTQELAVQIVRHHISANHWTDHQTTLILAAHGSGRSPYSALAAKETAAIIATVLPLRDIKVGFIEEPPMLGDVARNTGRETLCLPLFVELWGHVTTDIPQALEKAGFTGRLLDPVGIHANVPRIIAKTLSESLPSRL